MAGLMICIIKSIRNRSHRAVVNFLPEVPALIVDVFKVASIWAALWRELFRVLVEDIAVLPRHWSESDFIIDLLPAFCHVHHSLPARGARIQAFFQHLIVAFVM